MWRRFNIKFRLVTILSALVLLSVIGGGVMIWYTYRIETMLTDITEKHLASFEAAESLEKALVNQKGFVSYYFIDGDPDWLRQLGEYRQIFKTCMADARRLSGDDAGRLETLSAIDTEYESYIRQKDRVIELYQSGQVEEGKVLHQTVRASFFKILDLCEAFKTYHTDQITRVRHRFHSQAGVLRVMTASAVVASFLIAIALFILLVRQLLDPVRRLAVEAGGRQEAPPGGDEIDMLDHSVRGLLRDVDSTRVALEKSRESLLQSEKLAMVGKLAAGMAHSIRNPFTSVKMRLFSLGRSLELTEAQQDDLAVISDEIRHIDTIVQNFLEFSRPPRLKFQPVSPSQVVDQVLQLLSHRLGSYNVDVDVVRQGMLPEIEADSEQLKEVLVNLIINACEAMEKHGHIEVRERRDRTSVFVEIEDNGPGVPEPLMEKIFQPFFTTKEEGTGLGLSIATRIVAEHGGRLSAASAEGRGTTFTITFPLRR
jgi:signal transduction histidine kinase